MSEFITSPIFEIRFEDHGKSTGVAFATLAGDMLPMSDYMRVIVAKQAVRDACAAPTEFTVSRGDAIEHNCRIRANRVKAEERRRHQQRLLDMEERIAAAADTLRIDATGDDIARAAAAALTVLNRTEQEAGQ
ncbi:hypothetical protein FOB82_02415 [Corynebacterium xerosis]|uniref:Uncharacterized protein n=1 Tax=Corynebacterium xerosis TaxID=1725 RepID=A0A6B8TGK5_9CORY|nr:hypothetical protein [Corynebacterium xerosis]QGS33969.1 hypothetical protein FOB82_02415 [Corynebacterium xerosis]